MGTMNVETRQPQEVPADYNDRLPATTEWTGEGVSLPALIAVLRRGRKTIAWAALAGLVLAAVFAWVLPNTYTATTSFVPPGSNVGPSSAVAMMGQLSALGAGSLLGGKSQGDLYIGVLKSRTIAAELVAHFDLKAVYKVKKESQAEKTLAASSLFEAGNKDPIVTISVTDKSPERARDLANAYLQALQQTTGGLALSESSQRRLFYEQRLAHEKDDLANAEVDLKQTQEKTGLIAPAGQTLSEIQTLAQLRAQITDRQVRLASLLHDETDQNTDVIRLREEIGSLQAQVAQSENGQSRTHLGSFSTAQAPGLELEYIRKAREVKYHEALFEIIGKQYEAARLDEAKDSPLQVLDRAAVPDTKSGPHRTILMILGLLCGLIGGTVRLLWREIR